MLHSFCRMLDNLKIPRHPSFSIAVQGNNSACVLPGQWAEEAVVLQAALQGEHANDHWEVATDRAKGVFLNWRLSTTWLWRGLEISFKPWMKRGSVFLWHGILGDCCMAKDRNATPPCGVNISPKRGNTKQNYEIYFVIFDKTYKIYLVILPRSPNFCGFPCPSGYMKWFFFARLGE